MALHSQELAEQIVNLGGIARGAPTAVYERSGLREYPTSQIEKTTDVRAVIAALLIIHEATLDGARMLAAVDDVGSAGVLSVIARTTGDYLAELTLYQARSSHINEAS